MSGYKLSSKATLDVSEYYLYGINTFGLESARIYFKSLNHALQSLKGRRELWRKAFYIKNGLYKFRFKSHMIFFFVEEDYVFVVRILEQHMDFESHL